MKNTRLLLLWVGMLAVLVACERSGGKQGAATPAGDIPTAAAMPANAAELVTEAPRFMEWLKRDRAAVVHEIAKKEYVLQRRMLDFSGLTEELGGPERADEALRGLMRALETNASPPAIAEWQRVADGDEVSGTFAVSQATFELTLVGLDFESTYGEGKAGQTGFKNDSGQVELSVKDGAIEYSSAHQVDTAALSGKFSTTMKVNVCPDPAGEIKLEIEGKASMSRKNGTRGSNTRFSITVKRYVDDDAKMSDLEFHSNLQSAEFGGNAGTFVDMDSDASTRAGNNGTRINRRSSKATDADVAAADSLAQILKLMALSYTEMTRGVWESGKCVRIDTESTPAKREGVKPSTNFSLYAGPRSKVDGSAVGGTVRGTLKGEASLDPGATKLRADATFAYIAPGERNKQATVQLEARSKRGIALADVSFNTSGAAFRVEGGADEFHGSGVACDLAQQFFIEGSGVTVRFEPSSANDGRYSYSGNMSGFAVYGHGTYTVSYGSEGPVSIRATGPGSVKTPIGTQTANGTEEYSLTPVESAECAGST